MVVRAAAGAGLKAASKSHNQLKRILSSDNPSSFLPSVRLFHAVPRKNRQLNAAEKTPASSTSSRSGSTNDTNATKAKRKKLKGKSAVVKWLKHLRYKKKKEQEDMTVEEKILDKLQKARKTEERLVESLRKLTKESPEGTHDPEILTPEEHHYFLKMGLKCKNYVPVGRRGIYQGVILNMHLHWKKHEVLQVIVKTFPLDEVKEIAVDLAKLTGGIVLKIHEEETIIMYRGKNYVQPPTEIMLPRITLPRIKALELSKYRDGLRAVRKYIPILQQELELLHAHSKIQAENKSQTAPTFDTTNYIYSIPSDTQAPDSDRLCEVMSKGYSSSDDDFTTRDIERDPEALSDISETDSDTDVEQSLEKPLNLDAFDKIPPARRVNNQT